MRTSRSRGSVSVNRLAQREFLPAIFSLISILGCEYPSSSALESNQWVISSRPKAGASELPRYGPVYFKLDRRILPHSLSSTAVALRSGAASARFRPLFEPVENKILFELYERYPLEPSVTYLLEVHDLEDLDGSLQPEKYRVFFGTGTERGSKPSFTRVDWEEIEPIFSSRCAVAGCHGGDVPILGLNFTSPETVERTAVRVGSSQLGSELISAEGARGGHSLAGLSIIEAQWQGGQPAASYLMYKVLADEHILGDAMPPSDSEISPLSRAELKALSYWIIAGARLE